MRRSSCRAAAVALALALAAGCATLSVPEEQALGERFEREARRHLRLVSDPVLNDYVRSIGEGIVAAAGPQPFTYHFAVVDDPVINAMAGPAGRIYVHTGTILAARNASELAGVIAHEVGHVAHRHIAQNYNKQRTAALGQRALVLGTAIAAGGHAAGAANLLSGIGLMTLLNSFGREAEAEADAFAVEVLPRAGWDANGVPSFFETMVALGGPRVPTFLSSHPAPADRLAATRARIARSSMPPGLRRDDGGRLEIMQRRVALLTGESQPRLHASR